MQNIDDVSMDDIVRIITSYGKVIKIEHNREIIWSPESGKNYLCFIAQETDCNISMRSVGQEAPVVSLVYSFDKIIWKPFIVNSTVVHLENAGDRIFLKGDNLSFGADANNYNQFILEGNIQSKGNLMSIFDKDMGDAFFRNFACQSLFKNCSTLLTAPQLLATELSEYCYSGMFEGCSSLTETPYLPATELADYCYHEMFKNCTSLASATALVAESMTQGCYSYMFDGCSALISAPAILGTNAPRECCSHMFQNCTSLIMAPTILYDGELEENSECFLSMFYGCESLISISVYFTKFEDGATDTWVYNVGSTGTFYGPLSLANVARTNHTIPVNWNFVPI